MASATLPLKTIREDVVQTAVGFLNNPKVQSSPLTKKISFLESKGLTAAEIEEAVARSSKATSNSTTPQAQVTVTPGAPVQYSQPYAVYGPQQNVALAPPPQKSLLARLASISWRDLFFLIALAAGAGYGLVSLIKKYVLPYIQLPTLSHIKETEKTLDAALRAASEATETARAEVLKVNENVTKLRDEIKNAHAAAAQATEEIRTRDTRLQTDLARLTEDLERLKGSIPAAIDANKETTKQSLESLQLELKSLSKIVAGRSSSATNSPSIPSQATNTSVGALIPNSKPTLPAWQLQNQTPLSSSVSTPTASTVNTSNQDGEEAPIETPTSSS